MELRFRALICGSAFFLSLCATAPVLAETWECQRSHLSTDGFESRDAADSWFPLNEIFRIENDSVVSDRKGRGDVRRKKNRIYLEFYVEDADSTRVITLIPTTKIYTATIAAKSGFAKPSGTGGKCTVKK